MFSRILRRTSRPRLEQLLDRASRSERHREAFYRAMLEEKLWVPGTIEGGAVYIQPFDLDNRRTILAFTSQRNLDDALRRHAGALELPGRAVLETLPPFDAFILDYRTRLQKELTRSEVSALLDGSIFELIGNTASVDRVILGRPRHYPVALLDALRSLLDAQHEIRAAYLCQAQRESESASHIIIGFDCGAARGDDAFDSIAAYVLEVDSTVLVMALAVDAASEFMRRETEPWWTAR